MINKKILGTLALLVVLTATFQVFGQLAKFNERSALISSHIAPLGGDVGDHDSITLRHIAPLGGDVGDHDSITLRHIAPLGGDVGDHDSSNN